MFKQLSKMSKKSKKSNMFIIEDIDTHEPIVTEYITSKPLDLFKSPEVNDMTKVKKKRVRRVIPDNMRCMGRKIDGLRCTRSRITGYEFCRSHCKSLPNGKINDGKIIKPKTSKRGRKKKYENNDDYLKVYKKTIDGEQYFIDENQYIYTTNLNEPERIGLYDNNSIKHFTKDGLWVPPECSDKIDYNMINTI